MNKKEEDTKHYITLSDGIDFRTISKIMSDAGYQMNHATARNVLMSAMSNFLMRLSNEIGLSLNSEKIENILKNQEIHDAFTDILFVAYQELKSENKI